MNIKDILSPDEEVLFTTSQKRVVPGGKEVAPGQIFVTNQRVIIEANKWLGMKKEFEDLHYSDVMGIDLKQNVFSSELIIRSRFQGEIKAVGKKRAQEMEQMVSEYVNRYRYGAGTGGGGPQNQDGGGVRR